VHAYEVRLTGGTVCFASTGSKLVAAELALAGPASAEPPSRDPQRPAACFVRRQDKSDAEEPFWHAVDSARPAIPDEAALPEMPEDIAKDYDGSAM
jgi:hypothetical protein